MGKFRQLEEVVWANGRRITALEQRNAELYKRIVDLESGECCTRQYKTDGSAYWPSLAKPSQILTMDGPTTFFCKCPVCRSLYADYPDAVACCAREKQKVPYTDRPASVILIAVRSSRAKESHNE